MKKTTLIIILIIILITVTGSWHAIFEAVLQFLSLFLTLGLLFLAAVFFLIFFSKKK